MKSVSQAAPSIPLSVPNISGREWEYVRACLDQGWVSSAGDFVTRFEREFAAAVGAPHAVATASGTAALHVALVIAGVGPGDEVIVPALTFIAPANAVRYVGAYPVFVDVDPSYWQIDLGEIATFLSLDCERRREGLVNRRTGRVVRAILPVDILGHPADLDAVRGIADAHGLAVIEDATESLGARYKGRPLGSTSRLAAFSFNGNKIITTGGGGMLVTTDPALADRARYLTTQAKDDPVEFVHGDVGFNYRLTNVQAAIGVAQLERLNEFVARKRAIAGMYERALRSIPAIRPMAEASWALSSFWLYTIQVDSGRTAIGSRALIEQLGRDGIQARPLWQPLHRSPAHPDAYARACPTAEHLHRTCVSLPSSTGMSDAEHARVCARVEAILAAVTPMQQA